VKDKDKKIILVINLLLVIFLLAIALNNYLTGRAIQGINLSPPTDYVAYYSFDGNANDDTGNFHGVLTGVSLGTIDPILTTGKDGGANTAYEFNSFNRINLVTSPIPQNIPNGYAISAWVNRDASLNSGEHIVIERGYSNDLYSNNGIYYCRVSPSDNIVHSVTGQSVSDNVWHNIICNLEVSGTSATLSIYIDGSLINSQSFSFPTDNNLKHGTATDTGIGDRPIDAGSPGLIGKIDEVYFYDRALTTTEIASFSGTPSGAVCGNNIIETGESCDGNSQSCTINGYSGTQTCKNDCTGFNVCTTTESCGDGICNGAETTSSCSQDCPTTPPPPAGSLNAVITVKTISDIDIVTTGYYAPLPVFFEGWESTPRDEIAEWKWDFGDGSPEFVGFNAAHIYDNDGTYTARLTITNFNGQTNSVTKQIKVNARTGKAVYYVDSSRPDDNGDGLTQATAWKTATKAFQGLETGKYNEGDRILFKRGQTFDLGPTITLTNANIRGVLFSDYGTGAKPIIQRTVGSTGGVFYRAYSSSGQMKYLVFENLVFDLQDIGGTFFYLNYGATNGKEHDLAFYNTDILNHAGKGVSIGGRLRTGNKFSNLYFINSKMDRTIAGNVPFVPNSQNLWFIGENLAIINSVFDRSTNHNLYVEHVWKGVIANSSINRAYSYFDNSRTNLRLAGVHNQSADYWTEIKTAPNQPITLAQTYGEGYSSAHIYVGRNKFLGYDYYPSSNANSKEYMYQNVVVGTNGDWPGNVYDVIFEENTFSNAKTLLNIGNAENVTVRNNLFINGFDAYNGVNGYDSEPSGILIGDKHGDSWDTRPVDNIQIIGNTFVTKDNTFGGTGDYGLIHIKDFALGSTNHLWSYSTHRNIDIKNNLFYIQEGTLGIKLVKVEAQAGLIDNIDLTNNLYYLSSGTSSGNLFQNGVTLYTLTGWRVLGKDVNSIFANPLLTSPLGSDGILDDFNPDSDLSLQSESSPAIGAGTNLQANSYFDYTHNPRGSVVDIGAYEFGSAEPPPTSCVLSSASWSTTNVVDGTAVTLNIQGTDCASETLKIEIWENDFLIDDLVLTINPSGFSNNWNAVHTYSGDDDIGTDARNYYFVATLNSNPLKTVTSNELAVTQATTPPSGGGKGGKGGGGGGKSGGPRETSNPPTTYSGSDLLITGKLKSNGNTGNPCGNCEITIDFESHPQSTITGEAGEFSVTFSNIDFTSGTHEITITYGEKTYIKEIYIEP